MQRIVVGVDGSDNARAALHWAVDEARTQDAVLEVVMAWHEPYYGGTLFAAPIPLEVGDLEPAFQSRLDELVQEISDVEGSSEVTVKPRLVRGSPAGELLAAAEGADLLVVGSRGHGGFMGLLLGSVSNQVVAHATCPVVVVPGE